MHSLRRPLQHLQLLSPFLNCSDQSVVRLSPRPHCGNARCQEGPQMTTKLCAYLERFSFFFEKAPQECEKCYRCDRELAERSFEASLMRKGLVNLDYDVPWRDVATTEDTKEICEKTWRKCCAGGRSPEPMDSCATSVQFVGAQFCRSLPVTRCFQLLKVNRELEEGVRVMLVSSKTRFFQMVPSPRYKKLQTKEWMNIFATLPAVLATLTRVKGRKHS